jgi:hypothetical protein
VTTAYQVMSSSAVCVVGIYVGNDKVLDMNVNLPLRCTRQAKIDRICEECVLNLSKWCPPDARQRVAADPSIMVKLIEVSMTIVQTI